MFSIVLSKKEIDRHVISWVLITVFLNIITPFPGNITVKIVGFTVVLVNYLVAFYSMFLFVFPRFFSQKRYFLTSVFISISYLFFVFLAYINFYLLIPSFGVETSVHSRPIYHMCLDTMLIFTFIAISSFSFYLYKYRIFRLEKQYQQEHAILLKEIDIFKNQFSSHVLFNFLNFCYSNIHKHSKKTSQAIECFSDMLRYTTQIKSDEKVLIINEIEYIKKYILLKKILTSDFNVDFNVTGHLEKKVIMPRILLTFVENAIKHGISNDNENPIRIILSIENNEMIFKVSNKINYKKKVISTSTGLESVKQTLDLHYKDNYNLQTDSKGDYYNIELKIHLTNGIETIK